MILQQNAQKMTDFVWKRIFYEISGIQNFVITLNKKYNCKE